MCQDNSLRQLSTFFTGVHYGTFATAGPRALQDCALPVRQVSGSENELLTGLICETHEALHKEEFLQECLE